MAKQRYVLNNAQAAAAHARDVVITPPVVLSVALEVTGTAALLQNNFSQKAVEQMLRKHMGLTVQREVKRPRDVIEQATIYNTDRRVCISPVAFKCAMLNASTALKGLKKTQLRTSIFIEGGSIPITFSEMTPHMAMVRTSGMARTPDVRFRPEFHGWAARMVIQFSDSLSVQTVVDLLNRAGTVGVCEWRPEKNGTHGTFRVSRHISDQKEIAEVRALCAVQLVQLRIPTWAMDLEIEPEILSKLFAGGKSEEECESVVSQIARPMKANGQNI